MTGFYVIKVLSKILRILRILYLFQKIELTEMTRIYVKRYMAESRAKLLAAARKFKKKMLLEKLARQQCSLVEIETLTDTKFESFTLKKNWPKPFKCMAFYPEHTLTPESQKVIGFVKWALTLFAASLFLNALLQIVHIVRSDFIPFLLGISYFIILVPLVFRFVFANLYENLQFGSVGPFFVCASVAILVDMFLLLIPSRGGSPSWFEICMLFQWGESEVGGMFIITAFLTMISAIVMFCGIIAAFKGRNKLFRINIVY